METLRRREIAPAATTQLGLPDAEERAPTIPTITITSGPYLEQVPLAGGPTTVGDLRRRFGNRLDIDPAAIAVVGGRTADANTRVGPGDTVMFIHRAGEKGVSWIP